MASIVFAPVAGRAAGRLEFAPLRPRRGAAFFIGAIEEENYERWRICRGRQDRQNARAAQKHAPRGAVGIAVVIGKDDRLSFGIGLPSRSVRQKTIVGVG